MALQRYHHSEWFCLIHISIGQIKALPKTRSFFYQGSDSYAVVFAPKLEQRQAE